jgi:hypothetical protein
VTTYLPRQQLSTARARLTRAKKKAAAQNDPQIVLDEVARTFREWDEADAAYPDTWHTWEAAASDALTAKRYGVPPRF